MCFCDLKFKSNALICIVQQVLLTHQYYAKSKEFEGLNLCLRIECNMTLILLF